MSTTTEPLAHIKARRDGLLSIITGQIPFGEYLGVSVERLGNELSFIMKYDEKLIGNPIAKALHGGGVAGFMEYAAIVGLCWSRNWQLIEEGSLTIEQIDAAKGLMLPKTIDFMVDYLRPGLPRDAYARARVNRSGRRYASVHVEAWQDYRDRIFAQATGHFLMPAETLVNK